jgi:hypothetical protein
VFTRLFGVVRTAFLPDARVVICVDEFSPVNTCRVRKPCDGREAALPIPDASPDHERVTRHRVRAIMDTAVQDRQCGKFSHPTD